MLPVRIKLHTFFLFLLAPLAGVFLTFYTDDFVQGIKVSDLEINTKEQKNITQQISTDNKEVLHVLSGLQTNMEEKKTTYENSKKSVEQLVTESKEHIKKSEDVLDVLLTNMLGKPVDQHFGAKSTIKVFSLEEAGYRGYMAKIRLQDPSALKMVLAEDKVVSSGETTSHAAKRTGAVLSINAGGFMSVGNKMAPLGATVVNGKLMTHSNNTKLSFVGFNNQGKLVGGPIPTQQEIKEKGITQGASFLPTLLFNGKKQPIPREWANQKAPRTLIGHFTNGDLLVVVVDGRRKGWSQGITLEEAQNKFLEFRIKDAYNLDGGGSSVFYFNEKILNKPSDNRERLVTTNLVVLP